MIFQEKYFSCYILLSYQILLFELFDCLYVLRYWAIWVLQILFLTIIHKTLETNSSFQVKYRTTRKALFLFLRRFSLELTKFLFLWSFEIFLIFPNFLRPEFLSRLETPETTIINQFITNNHVLFHLLWKKNLPNHQKVLTYYEQGCPRNFLLIFMSLLTALIVKGSHILAVIYFIFIEKVS